MRHPALLAAGAVVLALLAIAQGMSLGVDGWIAFACQATAFALGWWTRGRWAPTPRHARRL